MTLYPEQISQSIRRLDTVTSRKKTLLLTGLAAVALSLPTAAVADEIDFARDIFPILERSCIECHGPTEDKGDLRLDTQAHAFDADYIIVPGAPEDSELYYLVALPPGDPDIMPSEGDPLVAAEIALLRQWIEEGAPWEDVELSIDFAAEAKPQLAEEVFTDYEVTAAESAALALLRANRVAVSSLAQNSNLVKVTFRASSGTLEDHVIQALPDIANLHDLDLSGTDISDKDLSTIGSIPNLQKLNLSATTISDEGLSHLSILFDLRTLNLYGTNVTDEGLEHLATLQKLENLYLWQTQVTSVGVTHLKENLPQLETNTGADILPDLENPVSKVTEETDEESL
ncbi:MAG: hypothetical protein SynsKO_26520 [Synoicihabitans sp.]